MVQRLTVVSSKGRWCHHQGDRDEVATEGRERTVGAAGVEPLDQLGASAMWRYALPIARPIAMDGVAPPRR